MNRSWTLPIVGFALALSLRIVGLDFFLPHQSDPDDHAIDQLQQIQTGESDYAYSWGKYGHLIPRGMSVLPTPQTDKALEPAHAEAHFDVAGQNHLRARWVSAILGALAVPGTYWLARYWFSGGWSLLAALFAGTSLLHVSFSQQARPHVPFATLALFAVLAAMQLRRTPTAKHMALYLVMLFLSVGTLHSAAFLLPAGLLAVWFSRRPGRFPLPALAWQAFAVIVSLAAFWPFLYGPVETFTFNEQEASNRFPHMLGMSMFTGEGFRIWYDALKGYDPVLLWAAALGFVGALIRLVHWKKAAADPDRAERQKDLLVMLGFALPCTLAFGLFRYSFERFFIPLYPYLGLLAALALYDVTGLFSRVVPRLRAPIGFVLAALALALPTYASVRLVWLRSQPDTYQLAAQFLAPTQSEERILLHPRAFLPLAGHLDESANPASRRFPYSSAWLRYMSKRNAQNFEDGGTEFLAFPPELNRVARSGQPEHVQELCEILPTMGSTIALCIMSEGSGRTEGLKQALARIADRVWLTPHTEGAVYANDGYQEDDMLHAVLNAEVWGPRLALFRIREDERTGADLDEASTNSGATQAE